MEINTSVTSYKVTDHKWLLLFRTLLNQFVGSSVGEHHHWLEAPCLLGSHQRIGHYYYHVARLNLAGRSAIEAHLALAALAWDNISVEALTVVVVYNLNDRFTRSFQSFFLFTVKTDHDP